MEGKNSQVEGNWDSIHVVEVIEGGGSKDNKTATYSLTSTVMLQMKSFKNQ